MAQFLIHSSTCLYVGLLGQEEFDQQNGADCLIKISLYSVPSLSHPCAQYGSFFFYFSLNQFCRLQMINKSQSYVLAGTLCPPLVA